MIIKKAETKYNINDLIASRWSPRVFNPNAKIKRSDIVRLCEAGRWAPSCFNDQPYRFLVWDKNHNPIDYKRAFDCLVEWNQNWVKTSNVLLAAIADSKFRNGDDNRWGQYDTGAASENICLQATSMGLKAHQMGGFEEEKLKKEFNIPPRFRVMSMIAIGYQSENLSQVDSEYIEEEKKENTRRALGRNFFDSRWGNPITD